MLMKVLIFELILCVVCRVEQAHGNLKRILQTSMGDLCTCWDAINNLLVLQHTPTYSDQVLFRAQSACCDPYFQ